MSRAGTKKWWIIGGLLVVGIGTYAWMGQKSSDGLVWEESEVERGTLDLAVQATGSVGPENRLVVKPQVAGRVDDVLVEEGQRVKAGQLLAVMSSSDRAALIDMAKSKGEAEVKHWEEIYKPTPIVAPLAGVVIVKGIERGQTVSTGDTVFVISDRLVVTAQVDETDLARISDKQNVEMRLDAYSDQVIMGQVIRIAYESKLVSNVTVYDVRVLPDETPSFMRAGMSVAVRFLEEKRENILLVPVSYLKRDKDQAGGWKAGPAKVMTRKDKGKGLPEERTITLGINDGRKAEVVAGLSEGEIVCLEDKSATVKTQSNPFMPKRPDNKRAKK